MSFVATAIIAIVSILISLSGLSVTIYSVRHTVKRETTDDLKTDISNLDRRLTACEQAKIELTRVNDELRSENIFLTRKVVFGDHKAL